MASIHSRLTDLFGEEVDDHGQETFLLFAQDFPSRNLGFVDPKTDNLQVCIGDVELDVSQSVSMLRSTRAGGTTGSVLWQVTPLLSEWLTSPSNVLFQSGLVSSSSHVLELGSGVAGLIPISLGPRVCHFWATDQDYVLKVLHSNILQNSGRIKITPADRLSAWGGSKKKGGPSLSSSSSRGKAGTKRQTGGGTGKNEKSKPQKGGGDQSRVGDPIGNIQVMSLDWETDTVRTILDRVRNHAVDVHRLDHRQRDDRPDEVSKGIDLIVACDCIYNESLVEPFVSMCADVCDASFPSTHRPGEANVNTTSWDFKPSAKSELLPPSRSGLDPSAQPGTTTMRTTTTMADDEPDKGSGKNEPEPVTGPAGGVAARFGVTAAAAVGEGGLVMMDDHPGVTICLVAQQLRDELVFETWLEQFMKKFHVWRIPDRHLVPSGAAAAAGRGLQDGSGFAVHVGILRA